MEMSGYVRRDRNREVCDNVREKDTKTENFYYVILQNTRTEDLVKNRVDADCAAPYSAYSYFLIPDI